MAQKDSENVINRLRSIQLKGYILCLRLGLMLSLVDIESKMISAWQGRDSPHTFGLTCSNSLERGRQYVG